MTDDPTNHPDADLGTTDPRVEASDDLLAQLRSADPVDPGSLPTPTDPGSRQLLASILDEAALTSSAPGAPAQSMAAADDTNVDATTDPVFAQLPTIRGTTRVGSGRRWGYLAGAAAAVLVLVAGLLVFAPDNTPSALAAVHQAAEATANVESGQIDVTFDLEGTDGTIDQARLAGDLTVTFAGSDLAVTADVSDRPDELDGHLPSTIETRLVGETLYLHDGEQWYSVEAPALLGDMLVGMIDPRSVLPTVQELIETEEVGPASVDGLATTHYRSIVDLGDESLAEAQWLPVNGADIEAEGEITIDLFVDDDGLLRQLVLTGDVRQPAAEGDGTATFEVVTAFSRLGDDLTIDAPEGAVPFDPAAGHGPFED
jgi:hypothetical protein